MHRVIYRRNCPNCLRGFVGNFGRHADEEFQHCRLKCYEQKIFNVSELIIEWIQFWKASWSGNCRSKQCLALQIKLQFEVPSYFGVLYPLVYYNLCRSCHMTHDSLSCQLTYILLCEPTFKNFSRLILKLTALGYVLYLSGESGVSD